MREILFRGYSTALRKWFEGDLIHSPNINHPVICNNDSFVNVSKKTIGQYTGLTDKNGKKIFEGDIIVMNNHRNSPTVVKFCEFAWHLVIPNNYTYIDFRHRLENNSTKYEVIGNIYDNPKLLGGTL